MHLVGNLLKLCFVDFTDFAHKRFAVFLFTVVYYCASIKVNFAGIGFPHSEIKALRQFYCSLSKKYAHEAGFNLI